MIPRMIRPTLLVLAAGMGSRYGGLKQMDPVGPHGEWIIDYSVHDALQAGFGRVVFVIRREMNDLFRQAVGSRFVGKIDVDYVFQELDALPVPFQVPAGRTKPWGTGHAVLQAKASIREPFAVINADDFYGQRSYQALGRHLGGLDPSCREYAMVGYQLEKTLSPNGSVSRGICEVDGAGFLKKVVERTRISRTDGGIAVTDHGEEEKLTGREIVSLNLWGFTPAIFESLEKLFAQFLQERGGEEKSEFYIPTAVDRLVALGQGRVTVLPTDDAWFGVTYPEDKPEVVAGIRRLIDAGVYPERLWG
jgi:UTP-glucose-1-phosphate uridylyltransferase